METEVYFWSLELFQEYEQKIDQYSKVSNWVSN